MDSSSNEKIKRYMKEDGIHFVPVWRIFGFSGANMAVNLYMGITMIMSYYLNGYVGMAVVLASSFSTIMRLWDGVTDPIVGFLIDKFGGRFGKTRLCLVIGGTMLFVNSFLMFNVTDRLPETGIRTIFFVVFTLLYYIGYTFLNISNHVGNVCLTNDPSQRPILSIVGTVIVRVMRAVMTVVVASLAVKYGSLKSADLFHEFTVIGLVMMTLGIGTIGRKLGLKKAMQLGSWGVVVMDALAIGLWLLCDPKTLNLPGYTNGYGQAFTGLSFFTIMLFLVSVVGGGFQMITSSIIPPMIADVTDYEASRSGKYIPGMVGTLFSFMDKMISSFGPLLVGVGFAAIGFGDKFPDLNTPYSTSLLMIAIVFYYGLELIGALFNIGAMKFYDLTPEKMKSIEEIIYKMRETNE
ncbi:MFS transporter [Lacrimispora defluvii]|uniref:Na+/melibiose symporter-like transporter n=1 Tax=Lacrimispora defluvii TaxID=2719233 RepID=A0ABX1VUV7_9FIRM|nr:MFS transporter [Lacrimispora defluvii]NNJ32141.1 hypothetical protein [Lacrimispora defluvii]